VILRTATLDDAQRVAQLHAESWQRTYRGMMSDEFLDGNVVAERIETWRKRLSTDDPGRLVCLAEENAGTLIGFVCLFRAQDPTWGSYIENLHVRYDGHRRGTGRALMRSAAQWLFRQDPADKVYLWVMEANTGARRFYERLGAANAGIGYLTDPAGGRAPNCRYVWSTLSPLLTG